MCVRASLFRLSALMTSHSLRSLYAFSSLRVAPAHFALRVRPLQEARSRLGHARRPIRWFKGQDHHRQDGCDRGASYILDNVSELTLAQNDIPATAGFKVGGFPTIKFKPAGSSAWLDYEGDRSVRLAIRDSGSRP